MTGLSPFKALTKDLSLQGFEEGLQHSKAMAKVGVPKALMKRLTRPAKAVEFADRGFSLITSDSKARE